MGRVGGPSLTEIGRLGAPKMAVPGPKVASGFQTTSMFLTSCQTPSLQLNTVRSNTVGWGLGGAG